MTLDFTNQALKATKSLDAKQFKQVHSAILGLLKNPEPHDSQLLRGAENGDRRIDVGEYRVIYNSSDENILILVVGKRNDDEVYKIWDRMR